MQTLNVKVRLAIQADIQEAHRNISENLIPYTAKATTATV